MVMIDVKIFPRYTAGGVKSKYGVLRHPSAPLQK